MGISCVSNRYYPRRQLFLGIVILSMEFISLSISLDVSYLKGSHQQTVLFKYVNERQIN